MGEWRRLTAGDGHALDAYVARPDPDARAGLVICQEIMGVNAHIRSVADRFAAEGYLAVAPAFFDRREHSVQLGYGADDIAHGRAIRDTLPWNEVLADAAAAAERADEAGKVGIVGYCWGGSIAWLAACRLTLGAAVGYYGGQIHEHREETPRCPTMLHFGERDPMIPMEHVEAIGAAHPDVAVHAYPAGHGFNCDARADFAPESAARASERTLAFLAEHLA